MRGPLIISERRRSVHQGWIQDFRLGGGGGGGGLNSDGQSPRMP